MVGGIAIAMFVALVGFGGKYFGWHDPDGKIQLALVTSFILGIIGGFKSRGLDLVPAKLGHAAAMIIDIAE